jgi:uncharacterized protein with von Willebrand factor type A (vWA) domain
VTDAVVILDRSLHMPMIELYVAARRGAALSARHISSESSHRLRGVIGFDEMASAIDLGELDEVDFSSRYGSNLMAAVALGQELLDHRPGRLVTFSSFEPTAHTSAKGEPVFGYPPLTETIQATFKQIVSAKGEGIAIDAFCLCPSTHPRDVLDAINDAGGEVAYITNDDCEPSVTDYLKARWT